MVSLMWQYQLLVSTQPQQALTLVRQIFFLIGAGTGATAFFIDTAVEWLLEFRFHYTEVLLNNGTLETRKDDSPFIAGAHRPWPTDTSQNRVKATVN